MIRFSRLALAVTPLLLALSAQAAELPVYKIEPSHTRAGFGISHLGFSDMPGHFNEISGAIRFAPENVAQSRVDVTINASSVSMDNDALDKKLLGKEFFNVAQYPDITFSSTAVEKTGDNKGRVTGNLTLLGVTKPVTLNVRFNKKGFNKYAGAEQVGFSAFGNLKRSDFGMTSYIPDVGDEVTLYIQAEALAETPEKDGKTRAQEQGTQQKTD